MISFKNMLIEKVISMINNKIISLREINTLPTSVKNLIEYRLFYYDYSDWQKKIYFCQAELQTIKAYDHWSSWMVYTNLNGERELFDEITIQISPDSENIHITPHENFNKWKAYRQFTDFEDNFHEYEVEAFIDDYDY